MGGLGAPGIVPITRGMSNTRIAPAKPTSIGLPEIPQQPRELAIPAPYRVMLEWSAGNALPLRGRSCSGPPSDQRAHVP
jgi:hypothetical protein